MSFNLGLWDTPGARKHEQERLKSYPQTDVFLVCFSVVDRESFHNVRRRWFHEITEHSANVPFVLIGTKTDLRPAAERGSTVSTREGEALARELGAAGYVEVSAETQDNVHHAFDTAIQIVQRGSKDSKRSRKLWKRVFSHRVE